MSTFLLSDRFVHSLTVCEGSILKDRDTAMRIVLAAVDMVNRGGTGAVTTRGIAREAGVNPAAVNYHFGTRENLIAAVLDLTLSHLFQDWEMILAENTLSPPEKIYFFLDYMMEGMARYPGLVRSYIFEDSLSVPVADRFLEKLSLAIDGLSSEKPVRPAVQQAVSAVIACGIVPGMFRLFSGGSLSSEEDRRRYLLPLVNGLPGINLHLDEAALEKIDLVRRLAFKEEHND